MTSTSSFKIPRVIINSFCELVLGFQHVSLYRRSKWSTFKRRHCGLWQTHPSGNDTRTTPAFGPVHGSKLHRHHYEKMPSRDILFTKQQGKLHVIENGMRGRVTDSVIHSRLPGAVISQKRISFHGFPNQWFTAILYCMLKKRRRKNPQSRQCRYLRLLVRHWHPRLELDRQSNHPLASIDLRPLPITIARDHQRTLLHHPPADHRLLLDLVDLLLAQPDRPTIPTNSNLNLQLQLLQPLVRCRTPSPTELQRSPIRFPVLLPLLPIRMNQS